MEGREELISGTKLSLEEEWILKITNGQKVTRVEYKDGCQKGVNFVADVKRVILHYTKENNNTERTSEILLIKGKFMFTLDERLKQHFKHFHKGDLAGPLCKYQSKITVIIKEMRPEGSPEYLVMNCSILFRNEIQAYSQLFPVFLDDIAKEIIPINYHTTRTSLIFEDLQLKGFKMADREKGLNFVECSKVLEALAEFHYCSYKLKQTSPEQWDTQKNKFAEPLFCEENQKQLLGKFWENSLRTSLEVLKQSQNPELGEVAQKLEKFKGKVLKTLQLFAKSEDKFSVLCHGDLWTNNIMFRYHNEPGFGPSDVKLLDFQCMRHASPSLDILHFLCSSTEITLLGTHFLTLIKIYHYKLSQKMSAMPFSLEQLIDDIQKKILFGIFLGFMMIPCASSGITNAEEDSLNMNYLESDLAIKNNLKYMRQSSKLRIQQLILDLIKLGLINQNSPV